MMAGVIHSPSSVVMPLSEFYVTLKASHVGLAMLSGGLFALRGVSVLAGLRWAMHRWARIVSMVIDTALLIAALLLLIALQLNPFAVAWLQAKLALLVVYIVLGTFALKRARTRQGKGLAFIAALASFLAMYSIARAHHPLGALASWL